MELVTAIEKMVLALLCSLVVAGCDGLFMADGKVVNASGRPLADIAVSVYDDTMRATTRTDANGCFHLGVICSPFKHKVPLRVGDPGAAPVDTVDGPTMNLHLLITVLDGQVPTAVRVQTGANVEECAERQSHATPSNKPLERTALARR